MANPTMTMPTYSIVVPLYETARFLPDLLTSLERQRGRGALFHLECVFVDDSSPDGAGEIARDWLSRSGVPGTVLEQPNSGVSAARNAGLDVVTGDWVTFIDSDDFIAEDYVSAVQEFLDSIDGDLDTLSLVACNVVRYYEADDHFDFAHPLRAKFNRGNQVYALEQHPEFIQSQAASAFFPVVKLRASGVRFLQGLHAAEDALFVSTFLVTQPNPTIACVQSANYFYRQRASGDSAVDGYKANPDFYFGRFSRGYLSVFERAREALGRVPRWLGQYFLYDMRWFFPREQVPHRKATHLTGDQKAEVLRLISAVLEYLDPQWIRDYSITDLSLEHRNLMLALMGAQLLSEGHVQVYSIDRHRDLAQLRYYFVGALPVEEVSVGGQTARIVASKVRRLDYLDQVELNERIIWVVADDDLVVRLDGVQQQLITGASPPVQFSASRARMGFDRYEDPLAVPAPNKVDRPLLRRIAGRVLREAAAAAPRAFENTPYYLPGIDLRSPRVAKAVRVYAQRPGIRARFHRGWLLVDSSATADDNAEAVYWFLHHHRADVNAFFVLRKDSDDWARLKRSGARLLSFGSLEHRAALLHAEFVISSCLDDEIVQPIPNEQYWEGSAPWRFVYLHRGVLRPDSAILFNRVPIDLVTVASDADAQLLSADGTAYTVTELQVRVTGLPRHDAISRGEANSKRNRVVLFVPRVQVDNEQELHQAGDWSALLNDERLFDVAARYDLRLVLLPRPKSSDFVPRGPALRRLEVLASASSMAELLSSVDFVVTDDSEVSLDAAAAGANVGYFHCDLGDRNGAEEYGGLDPFYDKRLFGPVAMSVDGLIDLLDRQADPTSADEFDLHRSAIAQTLLNVDGGASARVVEEISNLNRVP